MNNTFNQIKSMIDDLELYLDADIDQSNGLILNVISKISNQFEVSASAELTKNRLSAYVLDNDVIDYLDANDAVYSDALKDDIREIQHAIINFFGEDA